MKPNGFDRTEYICPMHPDIRQSHPGQCPECGMDLMSREEKGISMHAGAEAAADFFRRFLLVTGLLVPLFLLAPIGLRVFGLPDFAARRYLQFLVASAIFYLSLIFFQHARHELKSGKYGMMTLVSLAVGSGYLFSAAATFIPALKGTGFYLEISTLIWVLLFGHFLEAKSSAAAGLFSPWGFFLRPEIGAILMSLSSVIVVINAMSLRKMAKSEPCH